ncbi:MAG: hypothetical protein ABI054_09700 [Planctomycetota bacterium]
MTDPPPPVPVARSVAGSRGVGASDGNASIALRSSPCSSFA